MFNRRIGGREDRAFQLRALGFPPRLTGRGIAAARRTPEEQRVLYLSYRMDRWDAVTMPVAVLDRVERSLKNAYDELKEARIIARSRAETTVSSPVAVRPPAVSPWKTNAVPPPVPTCSHCGMDPTSQPSPAVLGLKRAVTIVNTDSSELGRRQSPRTAPKDSHLNPDEPCEPKSKRACLKCIFPPFLPYHSFHIPPIPSCFIGL